MLPHTHPLAHPVAGPQLPGTWKLQADRAITLRPAEDGSVRVAHGRVWATYDGPHRGALNDLGDHVIGAGDRLWVRAGQRLVIQAWDHGAPAYFSWDPVARKAPVAAVGIADIVQPIADLRLALAIGVRALGRLAAGLAHFAWDRIGVRQRPACPHGA